MVRKGTSSCAEFCELGISISCGMENIVFAVDHNLTFGQVANLPMA